MMRFNRRLITILSISVTCAFVFFFITMKLADAYYAPMLVGFGWIFWLGLLSFFMPLFIKKEQAFEWFQEKYMWGSFILFAIHTGLLFLIAASVASIFMYE